MNNMDRINIDLIVALPIFNFVIISLSNNIGQCFSKKVHLF